MGIIQEQHPDRCRLFMQWKEMDWPILVDALKLYGVDAVPITYAIDEAGIVRAVNPKPADLDAFLERPAPASTARPARLLSRALPLGRRRPPRRGDRGLRTGAPPRPRGRADRVPHGRRLAAPARLGRA